MCVTRCYCSSVQNNSQKTLRRTPPSNAVFGCQKYSAGGFAVKNLKLQGILCANNIQNLIRTKFWMSRRYIPTKTTSIKTDNNNTNNNHDWLTTKSSTTCFPLESPFACCLAASERSTISSLLLGQRDLGSNNTIHGLRKQYHSWCRTVTMLDQSITFRGPRIHAAANLSLHAHGKTVRPNIDTSPWLGT